MIRPIVYAIAGSLLGLALVLLALGVDRTMVAVVAAMVSVSVLPLVLDDARRKPGASCRRG